MKGSTNSQQKYTMPAPQGTAMQIGAKTWLCWGFVSIQPIPNQEISAIITLPVTAQNPDAYLPVVSRINSGSGWADVHARVFNRTATSFTIGTWVTSQTTPVVTDWTWMAVIITV